MNKILIISCAFCLMIVLPADAQFYDETEPEEYANFSSWKNPFKPQLPIEEEKKKPVVIQPVKKKDPVMRKKRKAVEEPEPEVKKKRPLDITISGLIWNSDMPQAILNGKVIKIGDKDTEGIIEILDIHKHGVDLMYGDEFITIDPKKENKNE